MSDDILLPDETDEESAVNTEVVVTLPATPLDYVIARRIEEIKEESAKIIAVGLISIVGVSVIGVFAVTWLILAGAPSSTGPEVGAKVIAENLKALGGFLSTVFSPLLAFVLGYYFSEKRQT